MVRTVQLCPHSHQLTECQIFMWSSCINYIAINSAIYLKLVCSDIWNWTKNIENIIWNWTKIIKKIIFPSVFMYSGWGCSLDIEKIIFPSVVMELAKKWRLKYCSLECLPKLLLMVRCLLLCCVWPCWSVFLGCTFLLDWNIAQPNGTERMNALSSKLVRFSYSHGTCWSLFVGCHHFRPHPL